MDVFCPSHHEMPHFSRRTPVLNRDHIRRQNWLSFRPSVVTHIGLRTALDVSCVPNEPTAVPICHIQGGVLRAIITIAHID